MISWKRHVEPPVEPEEPEVDLITAPVPKVDSIDGWFLLIVERHEPLQESEVAYQISEGNGGFSYCIPCGKIFRPKEWAGFQCTVTVNGRGPVDGFGGIGQCLPGNVEILLDLTSEMARDLMWVLSRPLEEEMARNRIRIDSTGVAVSSYYTGDTDGVINFAPIRVYVKDFGY